jgi:hypothetical protein
MIKYIIKFVEILKTSPKMSFYFGSLLQILVLSVLIYIQIKFPIYDKILLILFLVVLYVSNVYLYNISYSRSLNRVYAKKTNIKTSCIDFFKKFYAFFALYLKLSIVYVGIYLWFLCMFKMFMYVHFFLDLNLETSIILFYSNYLNKVCAFHGLTVGVCLILEYLSLKNYNIDTKSIFKLSFKSRRLLLGVKKFPFFLMPLHIKVVFFFGVFLQIKLFIIFLSFICFKWDQIIFLEVVILLLACFSFVICTSYINNFYKKKYPKFLSYIGVNTHGGELAKVVKTVATIGGVSGFFWAFSDTTKPVVDEAIGSVKNDFSRNEEWKQMKHEYAIKEEKLRLATNLQVLNDKSSFDQAQTNHGLNPPLTAKEGKALLEEKLQEVKANAQKSEDNAKIENFKNLGRKN